MINPLGLFSNNSPSEDIIQEQYTAGEDNGNLTYRKNNIDKNTPILLIGLASVFAIILFLSEKPVSEKASLNKSDKSARSFIFENYKYFDMPLINHDLRKDGNGKLVFLLEYKLQSGMIISVHVDIITNEVTRHQKQLARTPLPEPVKQTEQTPYIDNKRRRYK